MRIVTWNCGMALLQKAPSLLALNPDIAVIQECCKKSVDVLSTHGFCGPVVRCQSEQGVGGPLRKGWDPEVVDKPFGKWVVPVRVHGAVDFNSAVPTLDG
jgi:hypothetical protein